MQESLFQKEIDEKEKIENLCEDCKLKPQIWDINIRTKCIDCNRKHFLGEFRKLNLTEKGFKVEGDKFIFYSHTTEKEEVGKNHILKIFEGFMGTDVFPYNVLICNDEKEFNNNFGITKDFADYLKKELKLKKITEEKDEYSDNIEVFWVNPNVQEKIIEFDNGSKTKKSIEKLNQNKLIQK